MTLLLFNVLFKFFFAFMLSRYDFIHSDLLRSVFVSSSHIFFNWSYFSKKNILKILLISEKYVRVLFITLVIWFSLHLSFCLYVFLCLAVSLCSWWPVNLFHLPNNQQFHWFFVFLILIFGAQLSFTFWVGTVVSLKHFLYSLEYHRTEKKWNIIFSVPHFIYSFLS